MSSQAVKVAFLHRLAAIYFTLKFNIFATRTSSFRDGTEKTE
jgi:hypothetical protein